MLSDSLLSRGRSFVVEIAPEYNGVFPRHSVAPNFGNWEPVIDSVGVAEELANGVGSDAMLLVTYDGLEKNSNEVVIIDLLLVLENYIV